MKPRWISRFDDTGTIDVNIHLGQWPFRRVNGDEPTDLLATLKAQGTSQACVSHFDGLFHRDVRSVNARLMKQCRDSSVLIPMGTVNPALPDWETDLEECANRYAMPGIRLHPNYHGYTLNDPRFRDLLTKANEKRLTVQLVVAMEDVRTQFHLMKVLPLDLKPLPKVLADVSGSRLMILNVGDALPWTLLSEIAQTSNQVWFDFARLEGVGGLNRLVDTVGDRRIVFGSHYPLFYYESAQLKIREAGIADEVIKRIQRENIAALLSRKSQ